MKDIEFFTSDDADFRPERLNRLIGYVMAKLGIDNFRIEEMIVSLEDRKGMLKVVWRENPTEKVKRAVSKAWEALNEPGENVEHEFPF